MLADAPRGDRGGPGGAALPDARVGAASSRRSSRPSRRGSSSRKRSTLDETLADARARRVGRARGAAARGRGAAAAAAEDVSAALLAGFDPASPLFDLPVLAEAARSLAAAARAAREARPGLEVVVDLAGTPEAPYYTGLTFSLDAKGGGGQLAGGGRYDGLLGRFGARRSRRRLLRRPRGARLRDRRRPGRTRRRAPLPDRDGEGTAPRRRRSTASRAAGLDFPEGDGRRLLLPDRDAGDSSSSS